MQANGILAKITFLEFFKSVGGSSWEEIMKKNEKSHEVKRVIALLHTKGVFIIIVSHAPKIIKSTL